MAARTSSSADTAALHVFMHGHVLQLDLCGPQCLDQLQVTDVLSPSTATRTRPAWR